MKISTETTGSVGAVTRSATSWSTTQQLVPTSERLHGMTAPIGGFMGISVDRVRLYSPNGIPGHDSAAGT